MSINTIVGRAGINPLGDYPAEGATAYPLDRYRHNNSAWLCRRQTVDPPAAGHPAWMLDTEGLAPGPDGTVLGSNGADLIWRDDLYLLTMLTEEMHIHVAISGSDANGNGSEAAPYQTVTHAVQHVAQRYMLGTQHVYIHVGAGTYPEAVILPEYITTGGRIYIHGAAKASTIIDASAIGGAGAAINQTASGSYIIDELTAIAPMTGSNPAAVKSSNGLLGVYNVACRCLAGGAAHGMFAHGGVIAIGADSASAYAPSISLEGSSNLTALFAYVGGRISQVSNLIVSGTVTWATAYALSLGQIGRDQTKSPTVTGSVTGKRYEGTANSIFTTGGAGANYYPGTVAGTVSTGAQYA